MKRFTQRPELEYVDLIGRRLLLVWTVSRSWEPLFWLVMVTVVCLIVPTRFNIGQNSDGLLTTLMSLQHLTFFFWEQDRFGNLLPWLTSSITDPTANAQVQLALRIGCGLCAPLAFCVPMVRTNDLGAAVRATLFATGLVLAFAPERIIHEGFIEATPYGLSLALTGVALLIYNAASSSNHRLFALTCRGLGLLVTISAYIVNASLVLVTVPLFALQFIVFGSLLSLDFAFASAISLVCVLLASNTVDNSVAKTSVRFGETWVGVRYYANELAGKPGLFLAAMLAVFVTALLICLFAGRATLKQFAVGGCILLVTAVLGWMSIGLSSWVVLNYAHPRYLVPIYFLMAALGGTSLLHIVEQLGHGADFKRRVSLGVCAALFMAAVLRSVTPPPPGNDIVDQTVKPLASAVAELTATQHLDGIAGDYWNVWPAVFLAEQQAHDRGVPAGGIFGITLRGATRRAALSQRLATKKQLDLACIDVTAEKCVVLSADILGMHPEAFHFEDVSSEQINDHVVQIIRLFATERRSSDLRDQPRHAGPTTV